MWIFVPTITRSILSLRILEIHKYEKCQGKKVLIIVDIPKRIFGYLSQYEIFCKAKNPIFVNVKTIADDIAALCFGI